MPMASAPSAAARLLSASFVIPQILTRTRPFMLGSLAALHGCCNGPTHPLQFSHLPERDKSDENHASRRDPQAPRCREPVRRPLEDDELTLGRQPHDGGNTRPAVHQ